jgi:hypothetical protein
MALSIILPIISYAKAIRKSLFSSFLLRIFDNTVRFFCGEQTSRICNCRSFTSSYSHFCFSEFPHACEILLTCIPSYNCKKKKKKKKKKNIWVIPDPEEDRRKKKKKNKKIIKVEKKKKNKKSKEAKLPILFWPFVDSLFWSLLVQMLTRTHLLALVVLFKNSGLAFVVLFKTLANFSP